MARLLWSWGPQWCQVCGVVSGSQRSGISVARCMGKSMATVTRDSALERGLFSTKWQAQKGQSQWGPFLVPAGWQEGSAHGEKACDGIPLHKHHSILAPCFWQSQLPPQVFLVVNILILAPSCCLLLPRSSPLLFYSPICTFQHPAPVHTDEHTSRAGTLRAVSKIIWVGHILSCLPHTGHCTRLAHPQGLSFSPN